MKLSRYQKQALEAMLNEIKRAGYKEFRLIDTMKRFTKVF